MVMKFDPSTGKLRIPGLATIALAAAAAGSIPSANWRLPITAAYDSGADSTYVAALVASSAAKTLPTFTATGSPIPASSSRDVSLQVGEVLAPGGFVYLDWAQTGSGAVSVAALESTDSTDGSSATGTWTANSFAPWKPANDASSIGFAGRGQLVRLAPGPARWVRIRYTTPASTTCLPYMGAFQLQSDGSHDLQAVVGSAQTRAAMTSRSVRAAIQSIVPGSDPIVICAAVSALSGPIYNEQVLPLGSNAQLSGVRTVYLNSTVQDVAYTGIRAYGKTPSADLAVGTAWQQSFDALSTIVGASRVIAPDMSFGRFLTSSTAGNAAPYVDDDPNSTNGTLPYNLNVLGARLKASSAISWNTTYDWPQVSDYIGGASDPTTYHGTNEDFTLTAAGVGAWLERLTPLVLQVYGQPAPEETLQRLIRWAGNPTTAALKARLQSLYTAMVAMYPTASSSASAARATLSTTINNLSTAYTEPAVTAPAILPGDPSITSGVLAVQINANDPTRFTRDARGVTSALTDRKSGYTFAQTTFANRPRLRPPTDTSKGRLGFLVSAPFDSRFNTTMSSTDAGLVGLLNAAGQPYTFFGVITVDQLNAAGADLFGIGTASVNILAIGTQANSAVPRLLVGDGTGSAYSLSPTDAGVPVGSPFAFAFRREASGALKYYRGGTTATGTTSRNAAVTGTIAGLGRRAQGTAQIFTGGIHEIDLFTGAMSDTEIANVLAGLQTAWGAV